MACGGMWWCVVACGMWWGVVWWCVCGGCTTHYGGGGELWACTNTRLYMHKERVVGITMTGLVCKGRGVRLG